jgi:Fur family ferric uptake transcriptional regulator
VAKSLAEQGLNIDRATVYRNLLEFAGLGVVNRLELGDHMWRFELRHPSEQANHAHFLCLGCGEVFCVAGVKLESDPWRNVDMKIADVSEILLKGHCQACGA